MVYVAPAQCAQHVKAWSWNLPLGKRSSRLERTLRNLVPLTLIEVISVIAGYFAGLLHPDKGLRAEERVRGRLIGLRNNYGCSGIGRGVLLDSPHHITLGPGSALRSGVKINISSHGWCKIGAHTHISHNSIISAAGGVEIGDHCGVSAHVSIFSRTYDRSGGIALKDATTHYAPVKIGNGVHIGMGARILPGVTIGDHAVLGAGAVVTKDVAAGTTVVGVPARPTNSPLLGGLAEDATNPAAEHH
ncbi:MAG: acyltransferase [Erythrobacter sp.]|nr:MAG: acyltransferase [Erythrobacter sp.]